MLDPACGSGNFLYVTLEHLKRLEGEVLNLLHDLGESQGLLELEGVTVDPHQFLGLEINPRAAKIAEMVLWIGYLQWHFRTHGSVNPPEPVLRDFKNIQHRDALIEYEREEFVTDEAGRPVTRWDGVTYKASPITGEPIPDESAQTVQVRYVNPRKAEWPQADYIVGNPPFIGAATMRRALGDGYVDAVRRTWPEVPESADFVMYWWHIAGERVRAGDVQRFGFITTNSIKQTFNRRVIEAQLGAKNPLSLAFAIPDHPWVDAADGAAVRIAMTVGAGRMERGRLLSLRDESETAGDEREVLLATTEGVLHADLRIGANIAGARALRANSIIANRGVQILAPGFVVSPTEATEIDPTRSLARPYRNGKDITDKPRGVLVLDPYPFQLDELRAKSASVYQWLLTRAKPERDHNPRASYRDNWWLFGENQPLMRQTIATVSRFVTTPITARHRFFVFLERAVIPDQALLVVAVDDAYVLGALSSRLHVAWALAAGGTLEDRPRYNKSVCFETFPFPDATPEQQSRIRDLAEQLDAHRKRQQAQHPDLTLTGMYNVLEKLRSGEALNAKDKVIHEQGLVSVLRELHDALDAAVFDAYGWSDLAAALIGRPGATTPLPDKPEAQAEAEEELLRRLVELNARRAAEEARGLVRWLRPDYQNPDATTAPQQVEAELGEAETAEAAPAAAPVGKLAWPKNMREQVAAVRAALARQSLPLEAVAAQFKRSPKAAVLSVIEALEELGMVQREGEAYRLQG
nr:DNA methyltransferase [Azoarcus sp. CIB]